MNDCQDKFLDNVMTQQEIVQIYLISGIRLQGTIVEYDETTLLLKNSGVQGIKPGEQLIYKKAVSTIMPSK